MSNMHVKVLAASLLVGLVAPSRPAAAQAMPPPEVTKPKEKPKPKESAKDKDAAGGKQGSSAAPSAPPVLLLSSDLACSVSIDGEKVASVAAKGLKKINVSSGQHLLSAATPDGKLVWQGVVDAKGGQQVVQINLAAATEVVSLDDFDKAAARVWIAYLDLGTAAGFAQATLNHAWGFHDQNISTALHMANQQLQVSMEELKRLNPREPSRRRVLDEATKVSDGALKFVDLMTKAITAAQSSNSFMGQPQDLYSQANAIMATTRLSPESWATLVQSEAFKQAIPADRKRELKVADDGQDWNLGLAYMNVSPLLVATVTKGSFAEDAGFKPGDRLVSAGGQALASIWDLKLALRKGAGRQVEVVFDRQGKSQKKTVKVPAQLPR